MLKNSKRKIAIAGMAVVAVSISIGIAYSCHSLNSESTGGVISPVSESSLPGLNPNGSEMVVRAFVIQSNVTAAGSKLAFTGTLQPRYHALVGFRVAGKILERNVELGERVERGQVLFRLDPTDFDLQLRVAEAEHISALSLLKQSSAEEARLAQLRSSRSVSPSDYELGLANRDVAQARVDAANRRLALATNQRTYCDLLADSDGLITSLQAEAGQVVNIGQSVVQLMQTDELEAIVSLPENLVADVKHLQAIATFWSHPGLEIEAELRELSPMADPMSRTFDARFKLKEAAPNLAIGMTATILLNNSKEEGLCIPSTSLASRNDVPIVWRIDPLTGHVEAVVVNVIQYRNETAVVSGQFRSGDQIVSAGVQRVDENSRVRIWESKR